MQAAPVPGRASQSCSGGGGTSPAGERPCAQPLGHSTPGLGLTLTLLFVIQDVPEAVCHTVQFSTGMDFAREDFRPTWTSNRGTLVKKKDQKQVGKSKGVSMG